MTTCDDCESEDFDEKGVCRNCGLVARDVQLVRLCDRSYGEDRKVAKSIVKFNTPDLEVYNVHSKNTTNKELKRVFCREKYYTKYSNFYNGYVEIKRMNDQLHLPKHVLVEATNLWRELLRIKFFKKHRVKQGIFAALLKLSCGIWDIPITFEEVAQYSKSSINTIKRSYMALRREKNFSFNRSEIIKYIVKYLGEFGFSERERKKALKIAEIVEDCCDTGGKKPMGYVAAIFDLLGITRKEVTEKFPISPQTVTARKQEIKRLFSKK